MIGVPSEPFVPAPAAYPPSTENLPVRRRAVFSSSVDGLESHHALPANASGQHQRLFVQRLHTDPRKAVRQSWSSELQDLNKQVDQLTADVSDLQSQVAKRSKQLGDVTQSDQLTEDNMVNGLVPVTGEGITLTIANPIAADDSGDGTYHRENSGQQIRLVTDADLQMMVSLLWKAGAEVIALNSVRVVTSTYISDAADGTLVSDGVTLETPYVIKAIGDPQSLANAVNIAGGIGSRLKVKYGSKVTVTTQDEVQITEVHESQPNSYAKTVD